MGLDDHHPGDPRTDQHDGGRDREQPVRRHGLHRSLHRAELVRHVLVEDARSLFEVLGRADERVDLGAGVEPASAYAVRAASNISSLYETRVVGEKPDQPIPTTPTRGSIPTVIPCRRAGRRVDPVPSTWNART